MSNFMRLVFALGLLTVAACDTEPVDTQAAGRSSKNSVLDSAVREPLKQASALATAEARRSFQEQAIADGAE